MIDASTLLPWSEPAPVPTGKGRVLVRKSIPDAAFWELWRTRAEELKAVGVQPARYEGTLGNATGNGWTVFWFNDGAGEGEDDATGTVTGRQTGAANSVQVPAGKATVSPAPSLNPAFAWLMAFTPEDDAYITEQFSKRETQIATNVGQFFALCRRNGVSVRIQMVKQGAPKICSVYYLDPELKLL